MRLVIQRVEEANVQVEDKIVGDIKKGALVLFGCHQDDTKDQINYLVDKLINLRMFSDENDKMNLSILDVKGRFLVVSQFTLYASLEKGRRPSFIQTLEPEKAKEFYELFIECLKKYLDVQTGIFGAKMKVHLINDGPVTFILDSFK